LNYLIDIYNHPDNKNGEYVHMFLASQGFNEGIDLKGVRHIHFFEPLVTMASDLQTIGRARRYCSHSSLDRDKGEWSVQIHRYLSDFPLNFKQRNETSDMNTIEALKTEIEGLKAKQENMKKMKDPDIQSMYGYAGYKAVVKSSLAEKTKTLKELIRNQAKAAKMNMENIKMIDEEVHNIALEKMKELVIIHQAIKESAVDCRVLEKFHNLNTKQPFKCQSWNANEASVKS